MNLKTADLVEEFYLKNREKFPDLSLAEMKVAINAPWTYLKKVMEGGSLETVRFKYFGTFQVYEGRAKGMLENVKKRLDKNPTDQGELQKLLYLKSTLEKFLDEKY